ncbi:MAG: adenosine deaminase, partial [Gammaproteobacteria bacterium]|nr:adenosine deaminase [Gammaproteobacteria bacterium]
FLWTDFVDFLRTYDLASSCIRTAEDYRLVTYEYLKECAAQGGIYSEFFISPDHAAANGLSYRQQLDGVVRGIEQAEQDYAIIGRIIITCVRHLGPDNAIDVARSALSLPHPYVVGFGMAGDENQYTAVDFRAAFELAYEGGLKCTAHAGEMAGPESIHDALKHLPIARIGHGVRSVEDPKLVQTLAKNNILLEICPGSNLAIGIYAGINEHPLGELIARGCKVALGTDDPPYFDTSLCKEYHRAIHDFSLSPETVDHLNQNAIDGAFCDDTTKTLLKIRLKKHIEW